MTQAASVHARTAPESDASHLASDQRLDILLIGFRSGRISAEVCWDTITKADLWPDMEVLLLSIADGRDVARARQGFESAPATVAAPLIKFLRGAEGAGLISYDSVAFIEGLLPAEAETDA